MAVARAPSFMGRASERATLDDLLARIRQGDSAVLVIRGEAGIGKTALMQYCARQASGCRVAQLAGVESELAMPYAALHQLCKPMLATLGSLPVPQQEALRVSFGLTMGPTPDRFLVGLAVLGVLAEVAAERPLVCLIDDAQWLDEPTRQVLGFVGRRLRAEAVLLLFAVRETADERSLATLPTLKIEGLVEDDARALLAAAVRGQLDVRVRDRIVAETRGNPLAMLELPRAMSSAELAGGFAAPVAAAGNLEEYYFRRIRALPLPTQRLLVLAAADPTGEATLLWRAAQTMGLERSAATPAESEQLLELGSRARFRHPLVRSAAYAAGTAADRSAAHLALAEATDPEVDAERCVWHRAAAAEYPNEGVASELERSAGIAQARAGLAAAAAFLERAVQLTADPARRADRALAAAEAHLHAGAFDTASSLLVEAQALTVDDVQRGHAEQLRGQIQYAVSPSPEAPGRLLEAAKRLEPLDPQRARQTYLTAFMASWASGRYAESDGVLSEVCRTARSAPPASQPPSLADLFLDGFVSVMTAPRAACVSSLRAAVDSFLGGSRSTDDWLQWGHVATSATCMLWDIDGWAALSGRHVELSRSSGALAPLSIALNGRGVFAAWCGALDDAADVVAEESAVKDVTGVQWYSAGALLLAGYRGRTEDSASISASADESMRRHEGTGLQVANWTAAILHNGHGRYSDALTSATLAVDDLETPSVTSWALPELVEAAVRSRQEDLASNALRRLSYYTLDDADWAVGVEARSRALVTEGAEAEGWYVEAVNRFSRTPIRTELARSHLVYGEWLRREGRRTDAREQLAAAYEMFSAMQAEGFSERARRELVATGEKVRKRVVETITELTPQEEYVARLARDGRSNAEIGAELFLSVRTVEWHLRKVFTKLGISSRKDLRTVLPSRGQHLGAGSRLP